jgi:hypothetical protein
VNGGRAKRGRTPTELREYNRKRNKIYFDSIAGWVTQLRSHCKKKNLPFSVTKDWFVEHPIPYYCPIFPWLKLSGKRGLGANDAQLDRKVPGLGYTSGNIRWVSARANRIKDNATLPELEAVCLDLKTMY